MLNSVFILMLTKMDVTNIKFHVRIKPKKTKKYNKSVKLCTHKTKSCKSFFILRLKTYVFTCFYSGFINITGVRDFSCIRKSLRVLRKHLKLKRRYFTSPVIDSISSRYGILSNLERIRSENIVKSALSQKDIQSVKFNRERFPAVFIRTAFGTILWFTTPSIIGVGTKTEEDLNKLKDIVHNIISTS